MKNKILILLGLVFVSLSSCTDDFNEINERPDALTAEDVSAKFFVTNTQTGHTHQTDTLTGGDQLFMLIDILDKRHLDLALAGGMMA